MTKKTPSPRDFERLSAYLDGQTTSKESAKIENRLKTDLVFRQAHQELRQIRALLQLTPRLRAPRNFFVTPEMVGARAPQPSRMVPLFSWASAVTSILFIVLVMGNFWRSNLGGSLPSDAPMAAEVMLAEEAPPVLEAAPMAAEADRPEAIADNTAGQAAPEAAPKTLGAESEIVLEAPLAELQSAPNQEESAAAKAPAARTAEDETLAHQPDPGMTAQTPEEQPLTEVANSKAAPEADQADASPEVAEVEPPQNQPKPFVVHFALEIAVGVIALGFGIAAYGLHRQK